MAKGSPPSWIQGLRKGHVLRADPLQEPSGLHPRSLLHTSFQVACTQQHMPQLVTVTCLRLLSAKQFQQQEPRPFIQLDFPDMLPAGSGSPSCCLFCHVPRLTGCLDFPISLVQCASIRWILDFPLLLHLALRIFGLSASLGLFLLIFAGGFCSESSQSLVFRGGLGPRVPSGRSFWIIIWFLSPQIISAPRIISASAKSHGMQPLPLAACFPIFAEAMPMQPLNVDGQGRAARRSTSVLVADRVARAQARSRRDKLLDDFEA